MRYFSLGGGMHSTEGCSSLVIFFSFDLKKERTSTVSAILIQIGDDVSTNFPLTSLPLTVCF